MEGGFFFKFVSTLYIHHNSFLVDTSVYVGRHFFAANLTIKYMYAICVCMCTRR